MWSSGGGGGGGGRARLKSLVFLITAPPVSEAPSLLGKRRGMKP